MSEGIFASYSIVSPGGATESGYPQVASEDVLSEQFYFSSPVEHVLASAFSGNRLSIYTVKNSC